MPKQKNEYFCETIFCSPNDFQKKKTALKQIFLKFVVIFCMFNKCVTLNNK